MFTYLSIQELYDLKQSYQTSYKHIHLAFLCTAIFTFLSFIYIVGLVGAMETNIITPTEAIMRCMAAFGVLFISGYFAYHLDHTVDRLETILEEIDYEIEIRNID